MLKPIGLILVLSISCFSFAAPSADYDVHGRVWPKPVVAPAVMEMLAQHTKMEARGGEALRLFLSVLPPGYYEVQQGSSDQPNADRPAKIFSWFLDPRRDDLAPLADLTLSVNLGGGPVEPEEGHFALSLRPEDSLTARDRNYISRLAATVSQDPGSFLLSLNIRHGGDHSFDLYAHINRETRQLFALVIKGALPPDPSYASFDDVASVKETENRIFLFTGGRPRVTTKPAARDLGCERLLASLEPTRR